MDPIELAYTSTTTSKIEKIAVLVCRNCKTRIPSIALVKDELIVKAELTCSFCKYKDKIRLNDYLLFIKALDSGQKCELMSHPSPFPATKYCINCSKWICNQCVLNHKMYQEKHMLSSAKLIIEMCKEHTNKKLRFKCETCNQLVCKTCSEKTHKPHNVKEINNEVIDINVFKVTFDLFKEMNADNKKKKEILINLISAKVKFLEQLKEDLEKTYESNAKSNGYIEDLLQLILMNYESFKNLRIPELYSNITTNFSPNKEQIQIDYTKLENSAISLIKFFNKKFIVQVKQETMSIGRMKAHNSPITCMIQLQDERLATGAQDIFIKIWNVLELQCLKVLNLHQGKVLALIQLQGGNLVSGSDDKTIKIWDVKDWNCLKTLSDPTVVGHFGSVWGLLELKNKTMFISVSSDKTFKIWNSTHHALIDTVKEDMETIAQLGDQRLVTSGCADNSIQLWNSATFSQTEKLIGHHNKVNAMVELKDYRLASGSYSEVIIWDLSRLVQLDKIRVSFVYALLCLNDGTLLVGSFNSLLFFDASAASSSNELINTIEGRYNFITNLVELKDKRIAITTWDAGIQLYNY